MEDVKGVKVRNKMTHAAANKLMSFIFEDQILTRLLLQM